MISSVSVGAKTLADLIVRWLPENELTTVPNFICSSSKNAKQEPLLWTDSFLSGTYERFIKSIWSTHNISPARVFSSAQICCSLPACMVCKGSWKLLSSTATTNIYLCDLWSSRLINCLASQSPSDRFCVQPTAVKPKDSSCSITNWYHKCKRLIFLRPPAHMTQTSLSDVSAGVSPEAELSVTVSTIADFTYIFHLCSIHTCISLK